LQIQVVWRRALSVSIKLNHCECAVRSLVNLEAQFCLLNLAVAVNDQPQRSVGYISIAHDLNVPAAVELPFIFD